MVNIGLLSVLAGAGTTLVAAQTCATTNSTSSGSSLVVNTNVGSFRGQYETTAVGPRVRSWLGIRFGLPTNGTRRFRPAQRAPVIPAGTVYNASRYAESCIDLSPNSQGYFSTAGGRNLTYGEDCLAVNIWAPETNRVNASGLPVMIWTYGGGFIGGSGSLGIYNGSVLASSQDVVVVTYGYRTNMLGFPTTASGLRAQEANPGLLDQRKAVEWVFNNIRAFGGDPERMILFGESAGAESIAIWQHAWQHDPIVKGYILESGSEYLLAAQTAIDPVASETAWQTIANRTGCTGYNASSSAGLQQRFQCLQNVSTANLTRALTSTIGTSRNFLPSVDNVTVLSQAEYAARNAAGDFSRLPLITGTNNDEGTSLSFYGGSGVSANTITTFSFTCPAARVAISRSVYGVPTWQYRYFGVWPSLSPNASLGAYHSSELAMVFGTYNISTSAAPLANQTALSSTMRAAWARFAADPQQGLSRPPFNWPTYNATGNTLIQLGYNNAAQVSYNNSQAYNGACGL
ncbi:hypothetical protein PYCC9005_005873 [Savitreella phatthalungensis]